MTAWKAEPPTAPPASEEFTQADFHFSCPCSRKWHETWPIPIRVDAMTRRLRYLSCPGCNGKQFSFIIPPEGPP